MANFLYPTTTAYLVLGYDNKKFCYWVSLLLKVEPISYTMGTRAFPDIYALARGPDVHTFALGVGGSSPLVKDRDTLIEQSW